MPRELRRRHGERNEKRLNANEPSHIFLCNIYFRPQFEQLQNTQFQPYISFCRWHRLSNCEMLRMPNPRWLTFQFESFMQFKAHKSHMAAVGTVAIPHEAGAFALASLAVPRVVKPQWCISQQLQTHYHIKSNDKRILFVCARGYSSCCSCRPAFCNSRRHRVEPAGSLNLPTIRITGSTPLTVSPHPSQHATDQRVKLPNAILQGRSCQAPPKQGEVWAVCFSCHKGLVHEKVI